MQALKVVAVFALICACGATDLESAKWLVKCSKEAIIEGVPELKVPTHAPLHFSASNNINISTAIPLVGKFSLLVTNITWVNLPDWVLNASQNSADSDTEAIFPYNLYWKSFVFECLYQLTLYGEQSSGKISITLTENNWDGELRVVKPSATQPQAKFTKFGLTWHVADVKVKIDGNPVFATLVSTPLAFAIKSGLNSDLASRSLGPGFQSGLQNKWATHPERVATLINWCKSRNV